MYKLKDRFKNGGFILFLQDKLYEHGLITGKQWVDWRERSLEKIMPKYYPESDAYLMSEESDRRIWEGLRKGAKERLGIELSTYDELQKRS